MAKEACITCGELDWLNEDGECGACEESFLEAAVDFVTGRFIADDPGYRSCNCEDYPCCGH